MLQRTGKKILIFLFILNPALTAGQLKVDSARFTPLPEIVLLAGETQEPATEDFQKLALVFSGVSEERRGRYIEALSVLTGDVTRRFSERGAERELADDLLRYLHQKYLKRYDAPVTGLDTLLDSGVFNCVSSSILYMIASDALHVETQGVRTKDHAFIKVLIAGTWYDVETTSSYGFNPGTKKEFHNEFGRVTGFAYTPPGHYADRRDISRREMLSLMLHNRIADLVKKGLFDQATGPAADLFELLKSEEALTALEGVISGVARRALDTGQFDIGEAIISRAVSAYRDFEQFQDLRRVYLQEWARALIDRNHFDDARTLLRVSRDQGKLPREEYRSLAVLCYLKEAEFVANARGPAAALLLLKQARKELGDDPAFAKAETVYAHNHVLAVIEGGSNEKAPELLLKYRQEGLLTEKDFTQLYVYDAQKKAETMAAGHRHDRALAVIEGAMSAVGREKALLKSAGVYAYNYAIQLVSAGEFEAARSFTNGEKAAAYLSASTRASLRLHLVEAEAETLKVDGEWDKAIGVLEEGLASLGRTAALLRKYEVMVHNHMIIYHDRKDWERAEEILLQGLRVHPASALLKNDLNRIQKLKIQ